MTSIDRSRPGVLLVLALAGFVGCHLGAAAPASAVIGVDVAGQCSAQYPESAEYWAGEAYIVAPSAAYSWRCRRFSKSPGGGTMYNLPVDVQLFCDRSGGGRAVAADVEDPHSWRCVPGAI